MEDYAIFYRTSEEDYSQLTNWLTLSKVKELIDDNTYFKSISNKEIFKRNNYG